MSNILGHRPLFILGGDFGNRTSIGFLRDFAGLDERRIMFNSFISEVHEQEYLRFSAGTQTTLDPNAGEYLLSYGGKHHFVGKLAQAQGALATDARGVGDRYWSLHNLILMLTMVAAHLSPRELREAGGYNPTDDSYECTIRMASSMPVSVFTAARVELIRQAMNGVHRFAFNGYNYVVTLEVGPVVMEGVGGLILHGGTGKAKKAVIDCGYWSSEILLKEGNQFVRSASSGEPIGIGLAFDAFKNTMAFDFEREVNEDEAQAILLAQARTEELPMITKYGKPMDMVKIGKAAQASLEVPGIPLQKMVSSRLGSASGLVASNIDPVIFVGGSSYYLRQYVAEKVPHVLVPREAENANARANCLLAVGYKDWKLTRLPTVAAR